MIKININYKYADALTAALKKEFDITFIAVGGGEAIGLVPDKALSEWEVKQVSITINSFKAGVSAVAGDLDKIQGLTSEITKIIEGI